MKHLLLSICALAAIFLTLPCQAQTYDFSAVAPSGQTLYYKIGTTGEVSVVHPNSNPSSSNAYISGVLTIPDSVFYNNIWYSVTSIGDYAFDYCTSLTSITIPNSVTSIGNYAFWGCSSLTSITIPNSVTSIGDYAFSHCSSLTSITIPNSVTSIGNYAFYNCSSLTSITIPNSVTSIGNYAFYICSSLTSITIPNSVTSIGSHAFYHCSSLTSITIPNSVTSIGNYAFSHCSSLTSITIPNSVTSIGDYAFSHCSSLTSITIPNSVTSIGNYAFYSCSSLTSITIPNSVTSIGNYAFYICSSLTSITIPNSVDSIGSHAFRGCSALISMNVSPGNPTFDSRDSCNAIIKTTSNTLIAGCKNTIIPNSVTSIGDYAFDYCSSLTSITIPNTVTSIGDYAFNYCTSLTSITIPNSVDSISSFAFSHCSSLTSITIPNSVTSIGNHAFYHCSSLTSITIPNSVTSIGDYAFDYCSSLTSITIPNSVTSIGNYAFWGCTSLTSITIPNSVTSIGNYAFWGCTSLTSITIPNSVTSIGSNAFRDCSLDTVNVFWNYPILLGNNYQLTSANVINIPCGTTANYQNGWGAGNYHEQAAAVLTLSVSDNNGTVTIVSQNTQQSSFCIGSTALIQAIPNYGYHFTQWNDGNTDNPRTVTITQDTTFTAFFAKNQYTLSVASNDNAMGSVTGGGTYEYLDTVTLIATATTHYHFVRWSDWNTDTSRTIIITDNLSLIAIFAIDYHNVVSYVNNTSYGHVEGAGHYPYGSTAMVTAIAHNGHYFREWDNGTATPSISFTITGDTSFTALFAPEIIPTICMVTVENDHNVLLWEKEQPVIEYNIHREGNASGVYELLATVPYDSLSTWTDTSSRPRTRSYRYRLSATDIYGHVADLSDIHKTMHLTIGQGLGTQWNLVWTEYEGADYTTYVIYRGTDPSNIQIIDIMPSGGNTTYTDVSAPSGNVYYQVGIMLSSPCNPSKSESIVLSNVATNSTTGIANTDIPDMQVYARNGQVFVNGECNIRDVQVYDISGKLLKTVKIDGSNTVIDIFHYAAGVYIVRANTENGLITHKVVR